MTFQEPHGPLRPSEYRVATQHRGSPACSGRDDHADAIRQLARLADVSHARANQIINKTAEHGIVLVERQGTAQLCSLNRHHLAADAVVALATLRNQLIELLSRDIASWEVRAEHASLIGSAARSDGSTASDLDILARQPRTSWLEHEPNHG